MQTALETQPHLEVRTRRRRLLLCLDRSTRSEVGVSHALSLSRTFGYAVTLVHVMQPPQEHHGPQTTDALGWELSRLEARGYLDRTAEAIGRALGEPVDVRLEQGCASERIVDLAREIQADLIVLASRGESARPNLNLGSTAQHVLALAKGSVFLAHSSAQAQTRFEPTRIMVPLDGSLRPESVLPTASRLASNHHAELILVHVVQEPTPSAFLPGAEDVALARALADRLEQGATRYLKNLEQQLTHEFESVRTLVLRHPNTQQCLLETIEREKADLIVLSAHGSACHPAQSFGSVTTHLLSHARVPALVLQDLPELDEARVYEGERTSTPPPPLRASYAPESM